MKRKPFRRCMFWLNRGVFTLKFVDTVIVAFERRRRKKNERKTATVVTYLIITRTFGSMIVHTATIFVCRPYWCSIWSRVCILCCWIMIVIYGHGIPIGCCGICCKWQREKEIPQSHILIAQKKNTNAILFDLFPICNLSLLHSFLLKRKTETGKIKCNSINRISITSNQSSRFSMFPFRTYRHFAPSPRIHIIYTLGQSHEMQKHLYIAE